MSRRVNELLTTGVEAFSFLVDGYGFDRPETGETQLTYHRSDLTVRIHVWEWKHEAGFSTTIHMAADGDLPSQTAELDCLYVACGLGTLQDVPGTTGTGHTVRKRIAQHSAALQAVMPHLTEPHARDLIRRCQGTLLPD